MYSIVKLPKILSKSLLSNADEYLFIMKSDSKIINIDSYGNIHKFKTLKILQLNVKKILFLYIRLCSLIQVITGLMYKLSLLEIF